MILLSTGFIKVMYMIVTVLRICLFIYACLFCSVNFYYIRDDKDIIYNPKVLYIHLKQIIKSCM